MVKYLIISTFVLVLLVVAFSLQGNALAQKKGKTPVKELQQKNSQGNKDAIISDINNLVVDSYQYKILPKTMGGGDGSYRGYKINAKGAWGKLNPNGVFKVKKVTDKSITFEGRSKIVKGGVITITADDNGVVAPLVIKGYK